MDHKRWIFGLLSVVMTATLAVTGMPAAAAEESFAGLEGYKAPVISDVFDIVSEHTHGSGHVQLPDGEELVVWFQGNGERKANDGRIMAARRVPGGEWQEPFVIADTPGMPDVNPTVYVDGNDRLWLFWYPVLANQWESSQPKFKYAEKGHYESAKGHTQAPAWDWQEIMYPVSGDDISGLGEVDNDGVAHYRVKGDTIQYLDAEQFSRWEHRDDPTAYVKVDDHYITDSFVTSLNNGYMEAVEYVKESPLYADHPLKDDLVSLLEQTAAVTTAVASGYTNNWKQWNPSYRRLGWQTKNKPLEIRVDGHTRMLLPLYADQFAASIMAYSDDNGKSWQYSDVISAMGDIQAATVQKADGTLRSYFRNAEPSGYVVYHESTDGGVTWSGVEVEPQLRHVGGFDVVKLPDGRWVMAITETITDATEKKDNRARLNIAVSDDEGETWVKTPLEEDMTGKESYHYPAITVGTDGGIRVSYSYDDANNMNNIRVAAFEKIKTSGGGGSGSTTVSSNVTGNRTSTIVNAIAKGKKDVVVTLTGSGTELSEEVFAALAKAEKNMTVKGKDYTWTMDGAELTDVKLKMDMGVTLIHALSAEDLPGGLDATQAVLKLELKHSGAFPGPMTLTVSAGKDRAGAQLFLYHLDQDGVKAEGRVTVGTDGMAALRLDHASSYLLSTQSLADFSDIQDHWARAAILDLAGRGIVQGVEEERFAPNASITRAEFVTMLARIASVQPTDGETAFQDVQADDWFAPYVSWAVAQGITKGVDEAGTRFAPGQNITREQMAVMIERFAAGQSYGLTATQEPKTFTDADAISDFAVEAVTAVQRAGIIKGKDDGSFAPQALATRAEACQMLAPVAQGVQG